MLNYGNYVASKCHPSEVLRPSKQYKTDERKLQRVQQVRSMVWKIQESPYWNENRKSWP